MDSKMIELVSKWSGLNTKETGDNIPICSVVVIGGTIYLQERKFDSDTGKEVGPLLTAINSDDVDKFVDEITAFASALDDIKKKTDEKKTWLEANPWVIPPAHIEP